MAQKLIRGNNELLTWSSFLAGVSTDGDASQSITSDWCQAADRHIGLQFVWTGTPSGPLFVELSNDGVNVAQTIAAEDFLPALVSPAGSAGSTASTMTAYYTFFRVKFTCFSGSGTLNGIVVMKR